MQRRIAGDVVDGRVAGVVAGRPAGRQLDLADGRVLLLDRLPQRAQRLEQAEIMAEIGDDKVIDKDSSVETEWDKEEWQW